MATKYKYQESKGIWRTRVWDGTYTADGQKHYKCLESKKSSKDLENKVADFKKDLENQSYKPSSKITLVDYAHKWVNIYKASLRYNTKSKYLTIIDSKFTKIPGLRVADIKREHWYMLIEDETPATQSEILKVYRQVIKSAIQDHILPKSAIDDLITSITKPNPKHSPKRALIESEIEAVKTLSFNPMDRAYLWIIYGCGLRRSEALALTTDDIKDGVIDINKVLTFTKNKSFIEQDLSKTPHSIRKVPIPEFIQPFIYEYCKAIRSGQLFRTQSGETMSRIGYRRMWERITKQIYSNIGENTNLTAHIFRHNYTSRLMSQVPTQISFATACAMIGDSPKTLMSIYMHSIQEQENKNKAINSVF